MSNAPDCFPTVYDIASTAVSVCIPVVLDWMIWALETGESVPRGGKGDGEGAAGGQEVQDVSMSPISPMAHLYSGLMSLFPDA
jgi:hypothetical protein